MKKLSVVTLCLLFILPFSASTQVTSISFQLENVEATNLYQANLIINSGTATTVVERIQFNSQFSVVVPTGSNIEIIETFMPLANNFDYTGTEPNEWAISKTVVNPVALANHDFHSITPNLGGPTNHYNNLVAGDTIHLFSIDIDMPEGCPLTPRLFQNGVDPDSAQPGMAGSDFSNGFTLGSSNQLYMGNSQDPNFEDFLDISLPNYSFCPGECVDMIITENCAPYGTSYTWPDGTSGPTYSVCPTEDEEVIVSVSGPEGYSDELTSFLTQQIIETGGFIQFCIGETANYLPATDGTWTSTDPIVASITNQGLLQANSPGVTDIIYTNPSTCSDTVTITVSGPPSTFIDGPDTICVGGTTIFLPSSGGTWSSSDPSIGTIDNTGVVTGVSPGYVNFQFTDATTGCPSEPSTTIFVQPGSNIFIDDLSLCIGEGTSATSSKPNTTWSSSDTNIVTVDPFTGTITAVGAGIATVIAQNSEGCYSYSEEITVFPDPEIAFLGPTEICIGNTTLLTPNESGVWISSNNNVATISNNGLVTGVNYGIATFVYTSIEIGCNSSESEVLTVGDSQGVAITGSDEICIGGITTLSPNTGGSWVSSNVNVATVNDAGIVTGVGEGMTDFYFTSSDSSCASPNPTEKVLVNRLPTVSIDEMEICVGSQTVALGGTSSSTSTTSGYWESADTLVATISPFGTVTGIGSGVTSFTFNDTIFGCSNTISSFLVNPNPEIYLGGPDTIEIGQTSFVDYTGVEGVVSNSDTSVIHLAANGLITALSSGTSSISVFEPSTGCSSNIITIVVLPSESCGQLTGITFIDENANNMFDDDETPLRNVLVTLEPNGISVLSDDNGNYAIDVAIGEYCVTAQINEGEWESPVQSIADIPVEEPCDFSINFGFVPLPTSPQANVSMYNNTTRCDFETTFYITVENTSDESFEAKLEFEFDDKTSFFSSPIPGYTLNGNIVSANIGSLEPFVPQKLQIVLKMPSGSASLPILDFKTTLKDIADNILAEYGYEQELRCSYDPNDKRTFPDREGEENLTLFEEDIEYIIRFQNNGNDTAYTVRIVDQLDPNIDPRTIRVMSSSHEVSTCVEGQKLIFLFEDIDLVDSMTNYPGSQGYVTFKCNTIEGIPEMTLVNNQADIIFDTNEAIITNQTKNTMVSELCVDKAMNIDQYICEGESYEGYTESGTYTQSFELPYGCDSLVTINLEVQGISLTIQDIETCTGSTLILGGVSYTFDEDATLKDTTTNMEGCITNIVTYEVSVIQDSIDLFQEDILLCNGETLSLMLEFEGTYESSNDSIFTVDKDGNLSTQAPGTAILTFTDNETGCISQTNVIVSEPIVSFDGPSTVCGFGITRVLPSVGGSWATVNNNVATVTNSGIITTISPGVTEVIFTENSTGCTASLDLLVVPGINLGYDALSLCPGSIELNANGFEGTWESSNDSILTIDSLGFIVADIPGEAILTFTEPSNGCTAEVEVTIHPDPAVSFAGPDTICEFTTTQVLPSSGGSWSTTNTSIATVTDAGLVTALSNGTTEVIYTDATTGCTSSLILTVFPAISLGIEELNLCVGGLELDIGTIFGTWQSSNDSILFISPEGTIIANNPGNAVLTFTESINGCSTDINVTVNPAPEVSFLGPDEICIGATTLVESSISGNWFSNDTNIANVDQNGEIIGLSPGTATIQFFDTISFCLEELEVTVLPNSDPACTVSTMDSHSGNIVLFPNPAKESIYIDTERSWRNIHILDMQGRIIQRLVDIDARVHEVDLSPYKSGVYSIVFMDGDILIAKRFVVE